MPWNTRLNPVVDFVNEVVLPVGSMLSTETVSATANSRSSPVVDLVNEAVIFLQVQD